MGEVVAGGHVGGGHVGGGRLGQPGRFPGSQQIQSVGGGRVWLGSVKGEGEAGVGDHVDAFVGEVEIADYGVVEELAAGAVEAYVVLPSAAEVVAAGVFSFAM